MKNLQSHQIFPIIIILFPIFFILSKEEIINNPLLISEKENPIIIHLTIGIYYIYTSGEFIIIKSNGEIQTKTFATYDTPYIWIADESFSNYYIFSSTAWYRVMLGDTYYTENTKPSIIYPSSTEFIGSISETKNEGGIIYGCLCPIVSNEKIIYGRNGIFNITFSFLIKKIDYNINIANKSLEEKMACKKIQSGQYLCAIVYENCVHVYLFSHLSISSSKCKMEIKLESDLNNLLQYHTNVEIYNSNITNKKLICAKNLNTFDIECVMFVITTLFLVSNALF